MKQKKTLVVTAEIILRYEDLSDQSYAAGYRASKLIDRDEVLDADSYEVKKIKSARWIKQKPEVLFCGECGNPVEGKYLMAMDKPCHLDCYIDGFTSEVILEAPDAK